jgi:hypothetical protein
MNKTDDLLSFLKTKASVPPLDQPKISGEERKRIWLKNLDELYTLIKGWLKPLEDDQLVRYWNEKIHLTEMYIGSYEVDVLNMHIGNQLISFYPKGTVIVGAEGRVDVQGEKSTRVIIFNENQWFVLQRANRPKTVPFNKESFQDLLREVMK